MESLINKYRPKSFDEVVGHGQIVSSIKSLLAKKRTHAFLLAGQPGSGKTSLSRLIAKHLGCSKSNITEVNAANQTGVDDVRAMVETLQFSALGESPVRMMICDECQKYSSAAWSCLLKPIEEPPPNTFWAFCTTDPGKVPKAIATRCSTFELKPVSSDDIYGLLVKVRDAELMKTPDEVLQLLSRKCEGSPRQALSFLGQCSRCKTRKEAVELIRTVEESKEIIDLCRALYKGVTWSQAMEICQAIKDQNGESVRQVVIAYFSKVVMGSRDERSAGHALSILSAFSEPYPNGGNFSYVLLSLGKVILQ